MFTSCSCLDAESELFSRACHALIARAQILEIITVLFRTPRVESLGCQHESHIPAMSAMKNGRSALPT